MISTTYNFRRVSNLQGILLSAILAISILATVAPTAFNSANGVTPDAIQKITKDVVETLQNSVTEQVNVIIQTTDNAEAAAVVEELGGQVSITYKSIEALAASIPARSLLKLASNSYIVKIFKDAIREICYSGAMTENLKYAIPFDPVTGEPVLADEISGIEVEPIAIDEIASAEPGIYTNAELTGASSVWGETAGQGSTVVIIDTGVWSASPLLSGNVIGGVDISADVGTPYEGWNLTTNHYHGTACAHLLAAHALLRFRPGHPWGEAIYNYDPTGTWKDASGYIYTYCYGIAPAASIYAIKVFPHDGSGAPTSTIMQAIDIAIQMKASGVLDVDVISMSLGGGIGADGEDPEDLLVDAATGTGITVVAAAGNEGPSQLRVASPGSAKTAITVGAAMDPIHEWVFGDIYFYSYYGQPAGNGLGNDLWYPHDYMSIVDFSSRGPSADGRLKPEVVATGSWCFLGVFADGYIRIGGGTSYSTPQVAGVAALLNSYIEANGLSYGPKEIKQAVIDGAVPIPGFTSYEQGAGYVNALNALNVIKSGTFGKLPTTWSHHIGDLWFPPIDITCLRNGKATFYNILLEPAKYQYFAFWVSSEVDSIKITLSDVVLADPEEQNPLWGDAGIIYLSTAERGGSDSYLIYGLYFNGDGEVLVTSDAPFESGVIRLALAGDFSSYNQVIVGKMTIEVTEVWASSVDKNVILYNNGVPTTAQVEVYPGKIEGYYGTIKQGETDVYTFNIKDANGFAFVFLYWYRDWSMWATSDLDLIIINPDGSLNVDGATLASPEVATLAVGPGEYTILIDGYQVYFGKTEYYYLEIVYFADTTPIWTSPLINLKCMATVKSPKYGVAVVWLYNTDFDTWYIGGFANLAKTSRGCKSLFSI
ncbi:MAG: S8 family serine peptidase [Candidatus Bathyarchaeia archaeon]